MKRLDIRIFVAAAVSVAALLTVGPVLSQDNGSRVSSELFFSVEADNPGIFPVITEANAPESVSYDLASGEIRFSAGVLATGTYNDPFFCFDASNDDAGSVVKLRIFDPNGNVIAENFGLSSSLQYILGNNQITIVPPSTAQCFYRNLDDGAFGLFGEAPQTDAESEPDPEALFGDRFSAFPELSVKYVELASSVQMGDTLLYDLRIANTGKVSASGVSLQEVFPSNSSVYDSVLEVGGWECSDPEGYSLCPAASGSGPLRFTGLELPANSWMTFHIARVVPELGNLAGPIDLHAGVVSGTGSFAQFDAVHESVDVIGDPATLAFDQQPLDTEIDSLIEPPVVVHVVDDNGNRVTFDDETRVTIRLYKGGELVHLLQDAVPVSAGEVVFDESNPLLMDSTDIDPGTGYQLRASADLDNSIDGIFSVEFEVLSAP